MLQQAWDGKVTHNAEPPGMYRNPLCQLRHYPDEVWGTCLPSCDDSQLPEGVTICCRSDILHAC